MYVGQQGRHQIIDGDNLTKIGGACGLTVSGDISTKTGGTYSLTADGDLNAKVLNTSLESKMNIDVKGGMKIALEGGMEVHGKAGMNMVLEAGISLTLKVGGNFINISPAGIAIQGTMVLINSGGASGAVRLQSDGAELARPAHQGLIGHAADARDGAR